MIALLISKSIIHVISFRKGKSVIYLSTSDKREFYEKLGYSVCEPVSIYGGRNILQINNFVSSILSPNLFKSTRSSVSIPHTDISPPAPPPPPKTYFSNFNKKVYMRKVLSQ